MHEAPAPLTAAFRCDCFPRNKSRPAPSPAKAGEGWGAGLVKDAAVAN